MKYYLFNNERNEYWLPNEHGYTPNIEEAGEFDELYALEITGRPYSKHSMFPVETECYKRKTNETNRTT